MNKWILWGHVIGYLLCAVLYMMSVYYSSGNFPKEASDYLEWWSKQPLNQLELVMTRIGVVAQALAMLAAIGLLFFYPWARWVFLLSTIIMLFSALPTNAPFLVTPAQNSLDSLAALLSGLIVSLVYWSPLKDNFKKTTDV